VRLEFVEHEDRVYQDAPLRSVLAQVRFDPIPSLLAEAGTAGFHSVIRAKYPNGPERATDVDIHVTQAAVGVRATAPVWKFRTLDEQFSLSLSHDFLALETPRYTHFDDFLKQFAFALRAIERTLMPSSSRRVGLRKINAIPLPDPGNPATLSSRVRPDLLGGIAYAGFPAKVRGAEGALVFEEELNLLYVRYGLEGDAESEANFVLDMDYMTETPQAVSADSGILEVLGHFSSGITSFFEWALTEDYKMSLRPQPRGVA
jgi:uncharacterized protein (TIGR04255 family)